MQVTVFRGQEIVRDPQEALPALLAQDAQVVWIDLDRSRPEELRHLSDTFHFHPLAIEDAQKTGQRPKIEVYEGHLFLTIHAPRMERAGRMAFNEVDVFFTRQAVVTVRDPDVPAMVEAARRLERAPGEARTRVDHVLYTILDAVVDAYFPILDRVDEHIDRLEEHLLKHPTNRTLTQLLRLKRSLLEARRYVVPLRDTLNLLFRRETDLISSGMALYFRDIYDHVLRITDEIDTHRDLLTGALDVYLSIASNRLNEVMKVLTVITAVFAPLAVITGIYGMNFERAYPPFGWPPGFPVTLGVMALIASVMLLVFRRRGWL